MNHVTSNVEPDIQAAGEPAPEADGGHPAWCSPEHCYVVEDTGVRVHLQSPTEWEQCEARFEAQLIRPTDEPGPYLELHIRSLVLPWRGVEVWLDLEGMRRLRDQLTAHLDDAQAGHNRLVGTTGRPCDQSAR